MDEENQPFTIDLQKGQMVNTLFRKSKGQTEDWI